MSDRQSVVVIGAGGNIGSHLVPHLGRMGAIGSVTLIDRDVYEQKNLASQDITVGDVNMPKAVVQARRLRRINGRLRVVAVVEPVEQVPLGRLRSDVILGALDSREARRYVSEAAWHLGIPYLDAGVEPGGLLARIDTFVPGPDRACMQCSWDERDYAGLEQPYPCIREAAGPPPTDAPSALGALAASLQALEVAKILSGSMDRVAAGAQVLIDASYHKHYVTRYPRNPNCRFHHEIWAIEELGAAPADLTLEAMFALNAKSEGVTDSRALWAPGKAFVKAMSCAGCGDRRETLRLRERLMKADLACARCDGDMVPAGFDTKERLTRKSLPNAFLECALSELGLRSGDVIGVGGSADPPRYYVLGDP